MPLNVPGILVPFHLLIKPRLVLPGLTVKGTRGDLGSVINYQQRVLNSWISSPLFCYRKISATLTLRL